METYIAWLGMGDCGNGARCDGVGGVFKRDGF